MSLEEFQSAWICILGQRVIYALPCAIQLNVEPGNVTMQAPCASCLCFVRPAGPRFKYTLHFSCNLQLPALLMQCKLASTCLAMKAAKESAQQQPCQTLPLLLTGSCNTTCLPIVDVLSSSEVLQTVPVPDHQCCSHALCQACVKSVQSRTTTYQAILVLLYTYYSCRTGKVIIIPGRFRHV